MRITFWGAARQVTGSMYLLELDNDYRILVECGTDMDKSRFDRKPIAGSSLFPFEASMINAVILTHAHIDHSGQVPNLYREGFEGPIYCTPATLDLASILLFDSASLNRAKLMRKQKKRGKKSESPRQDDSGLYLEKHVNEALANFVTVPFNHTKSLTKGVSVTFHRAGHLLGASSVQINVKEDGVTKKFGFSGDIGRKNYPLLRDPAPFPQVDHLICESTYGARLHKENRHADDILEQIIRETCVDRPGRLIIPAFSVGRTQALLYTLTRLYADKRLPRIKVFSDSPMGMASTKTYTQHLSELNEEAREFKDENGDLFDFESFKHIQGSQQSRDLSSYSEPCIIISSSGMVSGGRVEHHVRANLRNPYSTIFLIGYCAEGTMGRKLLDGQNALHIDGEWVQVEAQIRHTDIFSGHGDSDDLVDFISQQNSEELKCIYFIHGEEESMLALKDKIAPLGFNKVEIPRLGQSFIV